MSWSLILHSENINFFWNKTKNVKMLTFFTQMNINLKATLSGRVFLINSKPKWIEKSVNLTNGFLGFIEFITADPNSLPLSIQFQPYKSFNYRFQSNLLPFLLNFYWLINYCFLFKPNYFFFLYKLLNRKHLNRFVINL